MLFLPGDPVARAHDAALVAAALADADEALRYPRRESQRRHVKVTEVATEVVAAYSGEEPKTKARN